MDTNHVLFCAKLTHFDTQLQCFDVYFHQGQANHYSWSLLCTIRGHVSGIMGYFKNLNKGSVLSCFWSILGFLNSDIFGVKVSINQGGNLQSYRVNVQRLQEQLTFLVRIWLGTFFHLSLSRLCLNIHSLTCSLHTNSLRHYRSSHSLLSCSNPFPTISITWLSLPPYSFAPYSYD